jgi:hypothetical protein
MVDPRLSRWGRMGAGRPARPQLRLTQSGRAQFTVGDRPSCTVLAGFQVVGPEQNERMLECPYFRRIILFDCTKLPAESRQRYIPLENPEPSNDTSYFPGTCRSFTRTAISRPRRS